MDAKELCAKTLSQISGLIQDKEISPVEVTEAVLQRIAETEDTVNAFITVLSDEALESARRAEKEILDRVYRGPLHGVPVSIKDIFYTQGVRTTAGSKILRDFVPQEDATVVRRMRESGAVFVGKTNMHEFAYGTTTDNPHYGPTRNPWDLKRIPGGSSGGSGAAVAAGLGFASVGTDTGGSIRIPASACGIVGLKPTYGRVSRYGIVPLSWSLDHAGPMTKTVEDSAILLQVIAGYDKKDATSIRRPVPDYIQVLDGEAQGLRFGIPTEHFFDVIDVQVRKAVATAMANLEGLGMLPVNLPMPSIRLGNTASGTILQTEALSYHEKYLRENPHDYGIDVRLRLEQGLFLLASHYLKAQRARTVLVENALQMFEKVDVLVTPTLPVTAFEIGQVMIDIEGKEYETRSTLTRLTNPINLFGFPAITVPCGFSDNGLPIGLQIIGRPFDEETVLKVAYAFEQSTEWHLRRPAV